uniref:Uncharacterized protein n=1 Tax=Arion vulgaris TaxID=1028688 RepID=A0A0B7BKL7_9EUPU
MTSAFCCRAHQPRLLCRVCSLDYSLIPYTREKYRRRSDKKKDVLLKRERGQVLFVP